MYSYSTVDSVEFRVVCRLEFRLVSGLLLLAINALIKLELLTLYLHYVHAQKGRTEYWADAAGWRRGRRRGLACGYAGGRAQVAPPDRCVCPTGRSPEGYLWDCWLWTLSCISCTI